MADPYPYPVATSVDSIRGVPVEQIPDEILGKALAGEIDPRQYIGQPPETFIVHAWRVPYQDDARLLGLLWPREHYDHDHGIAEVRPDE